MTRPVPSPKLQVYWVIDVPAGAMEPPALKKAQKPQKLWSTLVVAVNAAIGACADLTADGVRAEAGGAGDPASATSANAADTVKAALRFINLMVRSRFGWLRGRDLRSGRDPRSDDRRRVLQPIDLAEGASMTHWLLLT